MIITVVIKKAIKFGLEVFNVFINGTFWRQFLSKSAAIHWVKRKIPDVCFA
jgi:hypothetical protein